MKHLAYLNKYLYKYRWKLIPGLFFVFTANFFAVLPAKVIRIAFDLVQENIAIYHLSKGFERQAIIYKTFEYTLLLFGATVLCLALLRGLFLFFMRQTIILTSRHIEYDLKNDIYAQYQKLSLSFYRKNNTGDLMNRISEDVSRVRMYLGPAIMYSINTIALFGMTLFAMLQVNVTLTFYSLLPLPMMAILIYSISSQVNKKSENIQEELSNLTTISQETFAGIRILKAFSKEKIREQDFEEYSERYQKASITLARTQALLFPTLTFLVGVSIALTVYIGGNLLMEGKITTGNIAEFLVYVNQLIFPVMSLGWVSSIIQRAAASQKRINDFLSTPSDIHSNRDAPKIDVNQGVVFKNVNFKYPNSEIFALKNISLEIKEGEILAITGRTGSGKSTLMQLLMRMYDVTEGSIHVGQHNIKNIDLHNYRSQIGIVPQDVFLFSDTIANNIAFGMDTISQESIEVAAKQSDVYDNIQHFEHKFETKIGERGIMLSGGQKQRISIARAIAKDPKMLLFDDCLSAVDTKTEENILENMCQVMKNRITVIVAHRISTIKNAHKIIVLEQGEIVEQGTHSELLQKNSFYTRLYNKQLSEEFI